MSDRILDPKWDGHSTFTADELAEILKLSRLSVYEAIRSGQIPVVRIGRRMIIPRLVLEKLLNVAA
jgi:excisionase family DNA binding protein